ncbi:hypothetical protein NKI77_18195 [Mesorhizobium opportunistum]|uniref:Uncharacterized protein n=1 Tax=Mesorhizobium opportunistum TaxID=593909 RepID=A0ABV1YB75_9HYPH|nr:MULTISPECIES: hypothetical protein [Mesorhizobium]WJI38613.1 hypothetical protein NL534_33470 [Mesorhizobium opportunistum]
MSKKPYFNPLWLGASIPKRHWHFHRQLWRRYGIVLQPGEFSDMVRDIKNGYAKAIEKRSKKVSIYSVKIDRVGERVYVLSDGKHIITAWPPEKRLNEKRRRMRGPDH